MDIVSFIPIIILFILFFLRIPVAYSLLIATVVYFIFINNTMPVQFTIQSVVASQESFTYLAIPFFACAGVIFNYAGITEKLLRLADMLLGHVKGGMGQVNVLLSAMMGGLSGSANADTAMTAKTVIPEMTKLGYDKGFSTAVTAASAVITPIIPPGIILILYAIVANVSIADMFFAGYLPGLLIAVVLLITVSIISRKRGYVPSRDSRASLKEIFVQIIESIWALFLPLGILMGLRLGWFTPTEAGAMCVLYAALIGFFVYRQLKLKDIPAIIFESTVATAGIMFIIGAANAFGDYLTWERIPVLLTDFLTNSINNPYVLLVVITILLLLIGCFFEGGAAMILLAPLLVPVVDAMGIDLVFFGILMSINLTIAGITPPFGTMMFVATSITGVKIEDYTRNILPFVGVLLLLLFVLIFIPDFVMFIPNLLSP
ncbi:TRAP transporter large permease [Oceanobacillus jeddahense]|uniref:TRAP transporter large permease n=1 Tax=Oceanobacillus jeddahense TaxID=1462527 RepID=UPI000B0EC350|nr:TRAP transporter large permease [Oceanobacillus jeddahense]